MSDPAVEAARRFWEAYGYPPSRFDTASLTHPVKMMAIAAAREMAAPVRTLHRPGRWVWDTERGNHFEDRCTECLGKAGTHPCGCWADADVVPRCSCSRHNRRWADCPTARAVYTTDELKAGQ